MPQLPIVRLGHPALRVMAQRVDVASLTEPAFQALVDDMIETMRAAQGVGLAAPQVGVSQQLFVYEVAPRTGDAAGEESEEGSEDDGESLVIPLHVVVNPMLSALSGDLVDDWEGCLSIPDLRGLVPRHPGVRVRGVDRHGEPIDYVAEGFEARIIQHEYDHLNGVVFLDRMRDFRTLAYRDEWEHFMMATPDDPAQEEAAEEPSDPAAIPPQQPH